MARIVISLVLLVLVAVFIGLNLPYRTTVDIFGWRLEDAPSIIVILASVILGVLLSLNFFFLSFLSRRSRERMQQRIDEAKKKELELQAREQALASPPAGESTAPASPQAAPVEAPTPPPRRRRRGK